MPREIPYADSPFVKGNKLAKKEKLTEHQNSQRLRSLIIGWQTAKRKRNGEKVKTAEEVKAKEKKKRLRLKTTVAKEMREIQEIARTHAAAAMQRLADIVESDTSQDSAAIAAAAHILDRAYGKASQTNVNTTVNLDAKPTEVTAKQLEERTKAALKRIEDITGGAEQPERSEEQLAHLRKLN